MPVYNARAQAALLKSVSGLFPESCRTNHTLSSLADRSAKVNHLFELDRTADTLEELSNGIILGKILHELDSEFDPSDLESTTGTSKYLTNKRNIQSVYKGLFRFIRRQVPELSCQAKRFDYHAVAENPEPQGLSQVLNTMTPNGGATLENVILTRYCVQLLAVMVSAAAMGPNNKRYVPLIQDSLDNVTQAEIMQIIRGMQQDAENSKDDDSLDEAIDDIMEARDIDLLVEEQNAALRQQLEFTKKTLSDYITRLEHLLHSHEELKYEKEANDRELEVLKRATKDGANNAETIRLLEEQVHEQMDIIAKHEEAIRNSDKVKLQLEQEVTKLTQKSKFADELRDQATEWRHKAEELEKKANTAERYKQKLESQQHLVKEVQNLQYEKAELQDQLRSIMDDRERGDRLRKSEDELSKMLTQSEQDLWDERNQKTQLVKELANMQDELMRLRTQQTHDENFIQDLQEQLQHGGAGITNGEALSSVTTSNLEAELEAASDDEHAPNTSLELSRLKAENDLLRKTVGSTGDVAQLRREVEDHKKQRERLQQNFNEIFEKHTIVQEQIEALSKNTTGEKSVRKHTLVSRKDANNCPSSKAFVKLREEHAMAQKELEDARKKSKTLEDQLADKNRDLMGAKGELSAVHKDGAAALDELKSTDKLISESLKSELDRLREELELVTGEREAQKSQLIEALLAKDKLRKDAEEMKELQETAALTAASEDSSEAAKKANEKIEKLRDRLIERKQVRYETEVEEKQEDDDYESWPSASPTLTAIDVPEPPKAMVRPPRAALTPKSEYHSAQRRRDMELDLRMAAIREREMLKARKAQKNPESISCVFFSLFRSSPSSKN